MWSVVKERVPEVHLPSWGHTRSPSAFPVQPSAVSLSPFHGAMFSHFCTFAGVVCLFVFDLAALPPHTIVRVPGIQCAASVYVNIRVISSPSTLQHSSFLCEENFQNPLFQLFWNNAIVIANPTHPIVPQNAGAYSSSLTVTLALLISLPPSSLPTSSLAFW